MNPNKSPQIDLRANRNDINTWNDVHARMARRRAYAAAFWSGMAIFVAVAVVIAASVIGWMAGTDTAMSAVLLILIMAGGGIVVSFLARYIVAVVRAIAGLK